MAYSPEIQKIKTIPTECGVHIVDPAILRQAIINHSTILKKSKIKTLLITVNTIIATHINVLNAVSSPVDIEYPIRVPIEKFYEKCVIIEVIKQLENIGYEINLKYDVAQNIGNGEYLQIDIPEK